jgi:hypothetical protein
MLTPEAAKQRLAQWQRVREDGGEEAENIVLGRAAGLPKSLRAVAYAFFRRKTGGTRSE